MVRCRCWPESMPFTRRSCGTTITGSGDRVKYVSQFWDFVDSRAVVRRIMTLGTFAMTVWVIQWAMVFASGSPRPGSDVALILGAIMVPLNALQGFLFAHYSKGRSA